MKPAIVVHRSPAYLALRIIVLELAFEAAYLITRLALELVLQAGGFQVGWLGPTLQGITFIAQFFLLVYLVARWSNDTFELRDNEIVVKTGLAPRREVAYPYNNIQSVTVTISILGRLLRAGQISAYIPTLGQEIYFTEISRPHEFASALKQALPYPEKNQFLMRR